MRLYVARQTKKSLLAAANLKKICDEYLAGKYRIKTVDLTEKPQLAKGDQIMAIPILVRQTSSLKRIIGDLSNTERVLVGLNLIPTQVILRTGYEEIHIGNIKNL